MMLKRDEIPFRQIPGILWPCPVDHVHYLAPISNIVPICIFGILSHTRRNNPVIAKSLDAIGAVDISDPFVQQRRERRTDPVNNRSIHDYVPTYFATHTPMQYVKTVYPGGIPQRLLAFVELELAKLLTEKQVVIFTGNAASKHSQAYMGQVGIRHIKWEFVLGPGSPDWQTKIWKCAELLFPDKVVIDFFTRIVVYDEWARDSLRARLLALAELPEVPSKRRLRSLAERTEIDRTHYYG